MGSPAGVQGCTANCGGCHSAMLAADKQGERSSPSATAIVLSAEGRNLTVAHICTTMLCVASCACCSGSLPPQSKAGTYRSTGSANFSQVLLLPALAESIVSAACELSVCSAVTAGSAFCDGSGIRFLPSLVSLLSEPVRL